MEAVSSVQAGRRTIPLGAVLMLAIVTLLYCGLAAGEASARIQLSSFASGSIRSAATQAGAHDDLQTTFVTTNDPGETVFGQHIQAETTKDVSVDLPAGFAGSTTAAPQCSLAHLTSNTCPVDSQVGIAEIIASGEFLTTGETNSATYGVYLLQPSEGRTAEFGFTIAGIGNVLAVASVRSQSDYGLHVELKDLPSELLPFMFGARLTLWGVPADPRHDSERVAQGKGFVEPGQPVSSSAPLRPFLTNPTRCDGSPLVTVISLDSYQAPGAFTEGMAQSPALTGCERLQFSPTLAVQPQSAQAGTPAGYTIDLKLPQNEAANALGTADLKTAVVALPTGVSVSSSSVNGLAGCAPEQIGLHTSAAAACPSASKIGNVTITTPLLEKSLTGSVYLARQNDNPFGSLLALYVVAEGSGVVIKLPGEVSTNAVTGQLTATFDNNPQLPFSDLRIVLDGGPGAPLVNPSACGTYTTTARLTSYASATPVVSTNSFAITEGCSSLQPFEPSFSAGTVNQQGGAFSPFLVTVSRSDQDQALGGIRVQAPAGLLGKLAGTPLCPEAQARVGTCPATSQIGHTTVGAGAGSSPIYLPVAGQPPNPVYLTAGYKGAPFGLSVVVPAIAGPFNLGTVVVRAAINVDPHTAQVTITSDPLPTILDGIPLQVKKVSVDIDRPGFMFNPTSCSPLSVAGTVTSAQGASAAVASRFQAANCAALPFKPKLTASTQARASKASGASLDVKVASKGGPQPGGGEANIRSVRVSLPLQLPSRLTTLQKACVDSVFEANPASCPAASNVGTATASTPVLAHPLSGPAYLVSHGGAAFPDLEIVLQGEGITLILDGNTNIKKGITTSTFSSVPDAPISSFELKLPTGKYSVFGANLPASANYDFCGQSLNMPTTITGQNGAVVKPATQVAVIGCVSPSLRIDRHFVKGAEATIIATVPGAGHITATAPNTFKGAQSPGRAQSVTLHVRLNKKRLAFIAAHPHKRMNLKVKVLFTPKSGPKLIRFVTVSFDHANSKGSR
jgi:hypothetical protein